MKLGFLVNGIIELLGGMLVFFVPHLVFPDLELAPFYSKLYGIAASILGLISLLLWKYYKREELYRYIFLCLLAFHMMVSFHCYGFYKAGLLSDMGATILHLIVFLFLTWRYFNDIRPDQEIAK